MARPTAGGHFLGQPRPGPVGAGNRFLAFRSGVGKIGGRKLLVDLHQSVQLPQHLEVLERIDLSDEGERVYAELTGQDIT